MHGDVAQQVLGGARLRDDLEARLVEQARDPLAEEHRVVGEHDPDRSRAGTRAQRREVAAEAGIVELEDALGVGEVRQRPEPEVAELVLGRERAGRGLGQDDLAAVAGGRDAIGAVDVDADVAVLAERRSAGVQADANAHRGGPVVAAEASLRFAGRGEPVLRRREHREQLVAARVHLVPLGACDGVAQQPADVSRGRPATPAPAPTRGAWSPRRRRRGR